MTNLHAIRKNSNKNVISFKFAGLTLENGGEKNGRRLKTDCTYLKICQPTLQYHRVNIQIIWGELKIWAFSENFGEPRRLRASALGPRKILPISSKPAPHAPASSASLYALGLQPPSRGPPRQPREKCATATPNAPVPSTYCVHPQPPLFKISTANFTTPQIWS